MAHRAGTLAFRTRYNNDPSPPCLLRSKPCKRPKRALFFARDALRPEARANRDGTRIPDPLVTGQLGPLSVRAKKPEAQSQGECETDLETFSSHGTTVDRYPPGSQRCLMNEHGDDWRSKLAEEAAPGVLPDDLAHAREPGRGREANTPGEIPARGWKDILWRVLWGISEGRILSTSGGVAFFALLAVFPAIATIVSLYGLFADTSTIRGHLSLLTGILPGGILVRLGEQIPLIITQDNDTLGVAFMIGFLVALWSANSGVAALFDALNVLYGEKEKRSLLRFYATTFLLTLGMIGFIVLAIGAVVVAPVILTFMGFVTPVERLLAILRWPLLLVVAGVWLAVIYRYGPSRRDPKWRWVTWGSAAAAVLWLAAFSLVRGQLRQLQQDLRFARCRRRLHGVDLAVGGDRPA